MEKNDTRPRIRTNASLSRGDFGPYTVSNIKKMMGREGTAYSATIKRGRTAIADLIQDGNGGETRVYPHSAEARQELEAYVAEHWNFDLVFDGFGDGPLRTPHTVASFADAIFEEFDLRRVLARNVKANKAVILNDECLADVEKYDQVSNMLVITNALDNITAVYKQFAAKGQVNEKTLYWDGQQWAEMSKGA